MFKKIPFVLGQGGRRDVAKCIYVRPADLHLDSCRGVFLEEPSVYGTGHPHVMTLHVQCAGYISIVDEHRLNPLVNTAVNFREGPRYYVYLSLSHSRLPGVMWVYAAINLSPCSCCRSWSMQSSSQELGRCTVKSWGQHTHRLPSTSNISRAKNQGEAIPSIS